MFELIHVPTIMVCTFLAMATSAAAMLFVWRNSRTELAAAYWASGYFLGATSSLLIASRANVPEVMLTLGSMGVSLAYGLVWNGFRVFNGQRPRHSILVLVALIWLTGILTGQLTNTALHKIIILQSIFAATFSAAAARNVLTSPNSSKLPMALPTAAFFATHALFHVGHIAFAIHYPITVSGTGTIANIWWKVFMLEAFIHTMAASVCTIILIKDKSEQKHRHASETDSLTGIANRRAFVHRAVKALAEAPEGATLAIIDMDHFKSINDNFGHQAGDVVLRAVTRYISAKMPTDAIFGRLGGEEFALLLPGTDDDADVSIESLRENISEMEILHHGIKIPVTVSIGTAAISDAGRNFDSLVAAADCALYIAKEEGRNRSIAFSPTQRLRKIIEKDGEKRIGLADDRISRRMTRSANNAS